MTAINAFLKPDRAILMTDASLYDRYGLIHGFAQKTIALPTLKAAIAVRGVQKVAALLAMEMSATFKDYDGLETAGVSYFDRILPFAMDGLPEGLEDIQIVVVGWSDEHGRASGFTYSSFPKREFAMIDGYVMAPLPSDEEERNLEQQRVSVDVNVRLRDFDPVRHGVPLMEAQRRMKIIPVGADMEEGISIVGGNVLLTEVTRNGIRQSVVHHWADEIGENIAPAPFKVAAQRAMAHTRHRVRA